MGAAGWMQVMERGIRLRLGNQWNYLGDRVHKDNAVWVCCSAQGYGSRRQQRLWFKSPDARRGRVQEAASFPPESSQTATVYFGEIYWGFLKITYLNGDLRLLRVLLPSGSDVPAGFVRSAESAHFS